MYRCYQTYYLPAKQSTISFKQKQDTFDIANLVITFKDLLRSQISDLSESISFLKRDKNRNNLYAD